MSGVWRRSLRHDTSNYIVHDRHGSNFFFPKNPPSSILLLPPHQPCNHEHMPAYGQHSRSDSHPHHTDLALQSINRNHNPHSLRAYSLQPSRLPLRNNRRCDLVVRRNRPGYRRRQLCHLAAIIPIVPSAGSETNGSFGTGVTPARRCWGRQRKGGLSWVYTKY